MLLNNCFRKKPVNRLYEDLSWQCRYSALACFPLKRWSSIKSQVAESLTVVLWVFLWNLFSLILIVLVKSTLASLAAIYVFLFLCLRRLKIPFLCFLRMMACEGLRHYGLTPFDETLSLHPRGAFVFKSIKYMVAGQIPHTFK